MIDLHECEYQKNVSSQKSTAREPFDKLRVRQLPLAEPVEAKFAIEY